MDAPKVAPSACPARAQRIPPPMPDMPARMSQADPYRITTRDPVKAVKRWFALMERCCAAADYDAAERIFADDVVWFDINMEVAFGRRALRKREWEGVWDTVSNFKFDLRNIHAVGCGNRAWGAATWSSHRLRRQAQTVLSTGQGDGYTGAARRRMACGSHSLLAIPRHPAPLIRPSRRQPSAPA